MRIGLIVLFGLWIFPVGCAHRTTQQNFINAKLRPPSKPEYENTRSQHWVSLWKQTQTNSAESCRQLKDLLQEKDFPLNHYVEIQYQWQCQWAEISQNIKIQDDDPDLLWKAHILEPRAAQTQDLNDDLILAEIQWRLAQNRKDQELALQKLIDLNKKINNTENLVIWQQKLWKLSPSLKPTFEKSEWPQIARNFRDRLNYDKAVQFYNKSLSSSPAPEITWDLLKQLRLTYKLAQNKKKMILISKRWMSLTEKSFAKNTNSKLWSEKMLETTLTHARGLWTEDLRNEAERTLKKSAQLLKGKISLAEIYFILGRIQETDQHFDIAIKLYDQALNQKTDTSIREKILWAKAWILNKKSNYTESAAALGELAQNTQDAGQKWRALYWQAKFLEKVKSGAGEKIYNELALNDNLGFYGLMAQRELHKNIAPLSSKISDIKYESFKGVSPDLLLGLEWSLFLQEKSLTKIYIAQISKLLISNQDLETSFEFSKVLAQSGSYLNLFARLASLTTENKQKILDTDPFLLFPTYNPVFVEQTIKNYHYSSSLVFAIIRQESAFDPEAHSSADALGLMQLLPTVAIKNGPQLGLKENGAQKLYEPEYNIQIGALELEKLLQKWNRQYILAIASYNASEQAVKSWLKNRYKADPIEFIEEIPYEETRNYVKLVLRNYVFYERMKQTQPFYFDESLLKLKPIQ